LAVGDDTGTPTRPNSKEAPDESSCLQEAV